MKFENLPRALRQKKLAWLKGERAAGVPLTSFTQDDRDLLHMETNPENVEYWRKENGASQTDERALHCQAIMRSIICALRAKEPPSDDEHPLAGLLCETIERADQLPATH